jgi:hypothetical protein
MLAIILCFELQQITLHCVHIDLQTWLLNLSVLQSTAVAAAFPTTITV